MRSVKPLITEISHRQAATLKNNLGFFPMAISCETDRKSFTWERMKDAASFTISSERCNSGRGGAGLFRKVADSEVTLIEVLRRFD